MERRARVHSAEERERTAAAPARRAEAPGGAWSAPEAHPATVLHRALTRPGGPAPADALRLQRTLGNRAVGRLLAESRARAAAPAAVQRYHVLDPAADEDAYSVPKFTGTGTMFPASQKAEVLNNGDDITYSTRSPDKGYWGDLPRLRVSDGERMAIEDDAGKEQKVFFATTEVLGRSQQILKDVRSRNTLVSTGRKITVPTDTGNVSLEQIEPKVDAARAQAFTNLSSECNSAAGEIFNHEHQAEKILLGLHGEQAVDAGDEAHKAITANVTTPNLTARGLADTTRPGGGGQSSKAAADELRGFFPGVGTVAPGLLGAYADASVPAAARREMVVRLRDWQPGVQRNWYRSGGLGGDALEELRQAWSADPALDAGEIAGRHRDLEALTAYGGRNQANDSTFGINAYAAPEVGETFATYSVSPSGLGNARVDLPLQAGDVTALGLALNQINATAQAVDQALATIQAQAPQSWTWHYAAVVARDGGDAVTLENYNRPSEDRSVVMTRINQLYALHPQLQTIRAQVLDIIQSRHYEQAIPQSAATYRRYVEEAADALQALGITFETDARPAGERWFFQMYGPVKSTPGQADDQSFHHAWTQRPGEFSNPLTVRMAASADDTFKDAMVQALDTRVGAALSSWQTDDREHLVAQYTRRIRAAATRAEVARILEDAVEEARQSKQGQLERAIGGLFSLILPQPDFD